MGKVAGEQQAVGGSAGSRVAGVGGAAGRAGAQPGGPGALPLLVFEPSPSFSNDGIPSIHRNSPLGYICGRSSETRSSRANLLCFRLNH